MTQYEADGLISVLKRRKAEEVTLIEQKWEAERQRLEADRTHTMNRIHEHLKDSHVSLVNTKDEMYKARGKEDWKEKALAVKTASALVSGHQRELASLNRYYQEEFKHLRDKRDEELRKLSTKYSEERSRIMQQVTYPNREDQAKYWKYKYYQLKAEVDKIKEKVA